MISCSTASNNCLISARTIYSCTRILLCSFFREKLCKKTLYSGIEIICEFPKQCLIINKTCFNSATRGLLSPSRYFQLATNRDKELFHFLLCWDANYNNFHQRQKATNIMCVSFTDKVKLYTAKIKQARSFDNSINKMEIFIRVDWKSHRNVSDYFYCIHTFSAKLVIYSQTFINLKHIQKLEILYEFDARFYTTVRESNLSCFTDCTKHASADGLIHRQQTISWILHKQN